MFYFSNDTARIFKNQTEYCLSVHPQPHGDLSHGHEKLQQPQDPPLHIQILNIYYDFPSAAPLFGTCPDLSLTNMTYHSDSFNENLLLFHI